MRRAFAWAGAIGLAAALFFVPAPAGSQPPPAGFTVKLIASDGGGHGSAVHIGNGYLLTAAHVLAAGGALTAKVDNGVEAQPEVLWANRDYDIALLRLPATPAAAQANVDCSETPVGSAYIAFGNPQSLEFVSAAGRVVSKARKLGHWQEVVILDGTVVPGMSGGPVVSRGKVVGISAGVLNTSLGGMFPSITGFGIAVPGSTICKLMART